MINAQKKKQIGSAAANLIQDAEVVFIDGGTTAAGISRFIKRNQSITVVTPSVEIAYALAMNTNYGIYVLNGFLLRSSLSWINLTMCALLLALSMATCSCLRACSLSM